MGESGPTPPWDDTAPIRGELFSVERIEDHARSLATAQIVSAGEQRGERLDRRLADNEAVLAAVYRDTSEALEAGSAITPAAEWLIDNFYVIERQIREIRADLPPGYYRQLPKLATGPFAGYPRVFGVAWAFVAHTDSLFDPEVLRRFLRAYQEVQPLSIGELWAVAITLRIVLVENLRRIARRVIDSRAGRVAADAAAHRLLGGEDRPPEDARSVLPQFDSPMVSDGFLVELLHRLRDQDPSIAPALAWVEDCLESRRTTPEAVVREEQQRQISASVTVRNIISSMRLISNSDWSELFERLTLIDDILDTDGGFREMDFASRNLYRSAIETLARGSRLTELEVARAAVTAASRALRAPGSATDTRRGDPGYYLIAAGRTAFEQEIGFRAPFGVRLGRAYRALGVGGYVGVVAMLSAAALAMAVGLTASRLGDGWRIALTLAGLIPAIDLAVGLINALLTRAFPATRLPAVDMNEGIPQSCATMVVVPTLLTSLEGVARHIERLEVHFLTSPRGAVHFALLSDWADAAVQQTAEDDVLLAAATAGVAALNARHGPGTAGDRFLLLHRGRQWNAGEGCWMGWERKRGKLTELNQLLRGARNTSFVDPPSTPPGVRYIVTLDADTQLPRETVGRLIGKMAHPLNRPRFDPSVGRVVEGYGVMQPRVTPALELGRGATLFQRIFSSASGIDPYAAAASDVYQDVFGEGSFTGKGAYDIDAFEAALVGRVPESAILSHDLFEGVFARAALVSDVEVVECFPPRYDGAALRSHRWARGDWQLLPWILGVAAGDPARPGGGRMPAIGRWKMIDNLRRSLTAPALALSLILGFSLPLPQAAVWTFAMLATLLIPAALPPISQLIAWRSGDSPSPSWDGIGADLKTALIQTGLTVIFLGHQAALMTDAIVRTLWRMIVTRRRLLEWVPADQAAFSAAPSPRSFYGSMSASLVVAAAALAVALVFGHQSWPVAGLFAFAWFAAPLIAYRAGLEPAVATDLTLTATDEVALRVIARQTWRYFETFVTPLENMLPPDNFQEFPQPVVAHRTSPTNIGVYLLSVTSARDFGWIGTLEAVERLEATFATLGRMEKRRGHFLNWYDTRDLRPLDPPYISSVDSGNLAGHLIAIANACREWRIQAPTPRQQRDGPLDAVRLACEGLRATWGAAPHQGVEARRLDEALTILAAGLADSACDLAITELADQAVRAARMAGALMATGARTAHEDLRFWVDAAGASLASHARDPATAEDAALAARLQAIEDLSRATAMAMEFAFLIDPTRQLLSIGFQVTENQLDANCYDLLASEARLASFFAIAKGDVRSKHWFRLGHSVTPIAGAAALVSWSGSMFEYLMPSLVIRTPVDSLLDQTNRVVVKVQIAYGARRDTPWGVSESAYNARDREFTYQYTNFGIPGLGLKRGLADDQVIAPYATALASMVDPGASVRNFACLETLGARGRYGFYESLDFTPSRLPDGARLAVVRAFMAHHQGMTITAIANAVLDGVLRTRFHAEPMIQATELLLQERVPRDVAAASPSVADNVPPAKARDLARVPARRTVTPWAATPATQLLSNGHYTVMLTAAGSGYSTWRDVAVTRWREDATCDDWGTFILLRDIVSGEHWSATYQPFGDEPDSYLATFNEGLVKFERRDGTLETTLEVAVSAEEDAEVRRVTIHNRGGAAREIEITSYAEIVLGSRAADDAHPVFSKMFVETEDFTQCGAILATRRRRSADEAEVWGAHVVVVEGSSTGRLEIETDRGVFLGRGGCLRGPLGAVNGRPLSGATGAVLDPAFILRRRVRIEPGAAARVDFWTMAATTREEILGLVDKHQNTSAFERATGLAHTQAQVQLQHLDIDNQTASQFQRLAGHAIYASPALRAPSAVIAQGRGGQPGLWSLGISGDLPIILARISDISQIGLAREALQAVEYWRTRRLAVDLVIVNDRAMSYIQDLQVALETLVRASQSRDQVAHDRPPGHIFMLRADLIAPEAEALLIATARVVLSGDRGSLADHLDRAVPKSRAPAATRRSRPGVRSDLLVSTAEPGLEFFNGLGGFGEGGREYVTLLGPGRTTPAPWINVVANAEFGFQVSAEGAGFAWSVNSRDHQITPWSNDPVCDRSGQTIYLRDEDTGALWSPTAFPIRDPAGVYVARHGWGYSRFEHAAQGVTTTLVEFVPLADPIKISRLTLANTTERRRTISVTAYVEWVLGSTRAAAAPFVVTTLDGATGAIFATNHWAPAFADRVAFVDLAGRQTAWTGDRHEFLGHNGGMDRPSGLTGAARLSGRVGAGLDPCAALQTTVTIPPGGRVEVRLLLGDATGEAGARDLIARYRAADVEAELDEVSRFWSETTGAIQVRTPDRSMDIMLNGWLTYQTLACRVWGRAGFYQASGAYGFRDQLQDGMALATVAPALTREHLLRAGSRQFPQGDVQHWWLPNSGQGVRTHISDDRAWLAFAVAHYVRVSGDAAVLDAPLTFLEGPPLLPEMADNFFQPLTSEATATLYEHCALALDASLAVGAHGLPLIGGGDWNDGMNRVGQAGRGESVWLGWFLYATLERFSRIAETRGDLARATAWRGHMQALRTSLQTEAWDGAWYRRGWYDDGAPLGSAANDECRIDSIAQSWAVLSGAAPPDRAHAAMAAVEGELIRPQDGLALLFTPPFDRTVHDPGYIKSYPPGLRENGGQYTHGALWSVLAFAALGEGDKAAALFALLNPINHARTPSEIQRYRVEPFVVAADVYSAPGHVGRGGWTWYTGSAAWMQRAGVEGVLGITFEGETLRVDPCIPASWPGFEVTLRRGRSTWRVVVSNPAGIQRGVVVASLDGRVLPRGPVAITVADDGGAHNLELRLG